MRQVSVAEALERGRRILAASSPTAENDVKVLLAHILGKEKSWLLAHPEAELDAEQEVKWEACLARLEAGEPLPYVLGEWEFYGVMLKVTPAVLIPRPETEMLVETGLQWLGKKPRRRRALDVGTGSGCIPVALALNTPDLQIVASDISAEALEVAKANVERHHLSNRIRLVEANLMDRIEGDFDLITANLPYIPDERLPELTVTRWEPGVALGGGPDGLRFIRPFLKQASAKLNPKGLVLAEIDASLSKSVEVLARAQWPNAEIEIREDLAGLPRLLVVHSK